MGISYNKLWKLLIDKKMSPADLRKAADIAPNTLTRMKHDKEVTVQVLERICAVLNADFGDIIEYIIEYIPDGGIDDIYIPKMHNHEPMLQK